ncbi:MAG: hypothetical protein JO345_02500 [Streptosporangiaceae bacterium]|nr:hypothetical protein [Streptosporangiaceae bacterium]
MAGHARYPRVPVRETRYGRFRSSVDADTDDDSEAMRHVLETVDSKALPDSGPMPYSAAGHAAIPDAWKPRVMPWLTAMQALNDGCTTICGEQDR